MPSLLRIKQCQLNVNSSREQNYTDLSLWSAKPKVETSGGQRNGDKLWLYLSELIQESRVSTAQIDKKEYVKHISLLAIIIKRGITGFFCT